jgi:hypothetical protein
MAKTYIRNAYAPTEAPVWDESARLKLAHLGADPPSVDVKGSAWGFNPWDRIAEAAERVRQGNPERRR